MTQVPPPPDLRPPVPTQLIVFADDWGRHPSSSQHLVRELLSRYAVLWVNTVGTRKPTLSWSDMKRAAGVVSSWLGPRRSETTESLPDGLTVISPKMYPGYRAGWQREVNDRAVQHAVRPHLLHDHRKAVVTTLPTTAGLVPVLGADRWVYMCVDDYSQWPGTDHAVMDAMERLLVERVDAVACVSETLRQRIAGLGGSDSVLLTHGVDTEMWQHPAIDSALSPDWPELDKPVALFWGLIDERLDAAWCAALSACEAVHAVFAGPMKIDRGRVFTADTVALGPISHRDLPAHAAASEVLVMPYIDAPVTRAMQPLKLLEYLATMKPVVVRDLPSTRAWGDCCDIALNAGDFVRLVLERCRTGILPEQRAARERRLADESWSAKAAQLAGLINGGGCVG